MVHQVDHIQSKNKELLLQNKKLKSQKPKKPKKNIPKKKKTKPQYSLHQNFNFSYNKKPKKIKPKKKLVNLEKDKLFRLKSEITKVKNNLNLLLMLYKHIFI